VALFTTPCPVNPREQKWIEQSLAWLRTAFGEPRAVISELPADDLVGRLCRLMDVDPETITVELYGDSTENDLARAAGLTVRSRDAAGHYRRRNGRPVIAIDRTLTSTRLVATVAHELGHVRLDGRYEGDDHEPLTDLLTVHFGLGIFAANACFDFSQDHGRRQVRRLGYLTEPMYGYALACHAHRRGERRPDWAGQLDVTPRVYLKRGLRYLASASVGQFDKP
jgi:hypothetical protein